MCYFIHKCMDCVKINESTDREKLQAQNIIISAEVEIIGDISVERGASVTGRSILMESCHVSANSVIENSTIGAGVKVKSSFIEDSCVGDECEIGPFAHIRAGSNLGVKCRVGNFVEIKNSLIGAHSKMAHLSYIGDAEIGDNCNIGCGVVFCNYNGETKSKCILGDNVFVGSNSNLIAPLTIGDNAYIAGGSTINECVSDGEFAIARARQTNKQNFDNPYLRRLKKK